MKTLHLRNTSRNLEQKHSNTVPVPLPKPVLRNLVCLSLSPLVWSSNQLVVSTQLLCLRLLRTHFMVLKMQKWLDTAPPTNYSNEGGKDDRLGQRAQEGQVSCLPLWVTRALKLRPERCKAANQVKE